MKLELKKVEIVSKKSSKAVLNTVFKHLLFNVHFKSQFILFLRDIFSISLKL